MSGRSARFPVLLRYACCHWLVTVLFTSASPGFAAEGDLDSSFGNGGVVVTAINPTRSDTIRAMVQQPDGKLVVAGRTVTWIDGYSHAYGVLARYLVDGSLDTAFGTDGKVITALDSRLDTNTYETIDALLLLADGKLLAAGSIGNASQQDVVLVRYHHDGSLDTAFGTNGFVRQSAGASTLDHVFAALQQADGKLVVAGTNGTYSNDALLMRFHADGSPDTSFGGDGIVTTAVSTVSHAQSAHDTARAVVQQADGKLVIAGSTCVLTVTDAMGTQCAQGDFLLIRYLPDGELDAGFGVAGKLVVSLTATNSLSFGGGLSKPDEAYGLLLQPDGKLVAAGVVRGTNNDIGLLRLNSDGTLDSSFGTGGKVVTTISTGSQSAESIHMQADGKLLVAGSNNGAAMVARYTSEGALDSTFGSGGMVTTDIGAGSEYFATMLIQPDGKIVAAGYGYTQATTDSNTIDFTLARYIGTTIAVEDADGDGVPDASDLFPLDPAESADADGDGIGNNADPDDDNDHVPDGLDASPLDPAIDTMPLGSSYSGSSIRENVLRKRF